MLSVPNWNMRQGTDVETTKQRVAVITQHLTDLKEEFVDEETGKSLINESPHYLWR